MQIQQKIHHFGVGVDRPLYATLEEYGEDGGVMHYFWLLHGKMGENLCEGLEAAKAEAERLGWAFHSFSSYAEAVETARRKSQSKEYMESSNVYWVALMLAEHYEGGNSHAYMDICTEFSPVARLMGNDNLADDLLKFLQQD